MRPHQPRSLAAVCVNTFIQVTGQSLAGRAGEARGGPVDHGAGLPALGLSASAVTEPGAQDQEAARRRGLYR